MISDAARGDRLPTLAVTEAFVQACGRDPEEWRAKWHVCHERTALGGRLAEAAPVQPSDMTQTAQPEQPDGPGAAPASPHDPGRLRGRAHIGAY